MNKLQYIQEQLLDAELREALSEVVADVDALIPKSEAEFIDLTEKPSMEGCGFSLQTSPEVTLHTPS